jgi:hypothetical protein
MKKRVKYLSALFFTVIISLSLYADSAAIVTADPFPSERPGQFVYYHDMRTGVFGNKEPVNRLFGIMKADNKQYIIRVQNLKDGKSYLYLGRFILSKGEMEFLTESVQGNTKEATVIMADLLNLMNYLGREILNHSSKLKSKIDLNVNSKWESYNRKLVNSYKWWIPFYKLESANNIETDNFGPKGYVSLKLICFGSVSQDDPDLFTRINRLPSYHKEKITDKKYTITSAEKMKVRLDNTPLNLDKNWYFEKGDPLSGFQDSYWLKKFTSRDAQIGLESIETDNIKLNKNEIEAFVSSLQFQSCVIADTVDIDLKGKTLTLSLWDADNGTATFTKYISLGVKRNLLTVLNFSAFDFVYYSNIEYFEAILKQ